MLCRRLQQPHRAFRISIITWQEKGPLSLSGLPLSPPNTLSGLMSPSRLRRCLHAKAKKKRRRKRLGSKECSERKKMVGFQSREERSCLSSMITHGRICWLSKRGRQRRGEEHSGSKGIKFNMKAMEEIKDWKGVSASSHSACPLTIRRASLSLSPSLSACASEHANGRTRGQRKGAIKEIGL